MISKVIAGISAGMVFLSAMFVDSVNNTPIAVLVCSVILFGVAVMADKEIFM